MQGHLNNMYVLDQLHQSIALLPEGSRRHLIRHSGRLSQHAVSFSRFVIEHFAVAPSQSDVSQASFVRECLQSQQRLGQAGANNDEVKLGIVDGFHWSTGEFG